MEGDQATGMGQARRLYTTISPVIAEGQADLAIPVKRYSGLGLSIRLARRRGGNNINRRGKWTRACGLFSFSVVRSAVHDDRVLGDAEVVVSCGIPQLIQSGGQLFTRFDRHDWRLPVGTWPALNCMASAGIGDLVRAGKMRR